MRKDSSEAPASSLPMVMPKTEYDPGPPVTSSHYSRHSPPPYPAPGHVKEEPREAPPGLPPGFPPYYLPDLAPHHLYRQSADPRLAPHHPPSHRRSRSLKAWSLFLLLYPPMAPAGC